MERTRLTVTVEHYPDETPDMLVANVTRLLVAGGYGYIGAQVELAAPVTETAEEG